MKKSKKLLALLLVCAMAAAILTACGEKPVTGPNGTITPTQGGTTGSEGTTNPTDTPEEPPLYNDLGGMEIIIGDWWSSTEPKIVTARDEATYDYRQQIQADYNFKIQQKSIGSWGDHKETFVLGAMSGEPKAQIFVLDQSWVAAPLINGLFYDLATLQSFDFTEEKWNHSVRDLMTLGNSVYGMAVGKPEPRLGMFWNKRMFEDAGLEPDLPYDLQASGEWTWDKFYELCEKLTRDTNSDGVPDTYALASFSTDFFRGCAVSNMANFIGMKDGKYYNAMHDPEFLEAIQWGRSLIDAGFVMPKPEDVEWDWFIDAFHDTNVAMTCAEEFKSAQEFYDMDDDYGFVMFPKGPKADHYMTIFSENVIAMPACLDVETAEKAAFAYNLYTEPIEGYDDPEDFYLFYYPRFRDERAVDETLHMFYRDGYSMPYYLPLIDGLSYGDFCFSVYAGAKTPQEQIEEIDGTWQAIIDDFNSTR